jgi:acyl carrier protein
MDVIERLTLLVSDVLEVDPEMVDSSSSRENLAEWDSLAHLRIVGAVEEEFAVKLTMQEINEISSIEALQQLIAKRKS